MKSFKLWQKRYKLFCAPIINFKDQQFWLYKLYITTKYHKGNSLSRMQLKYLNNDTTFPMYLF